MKKLCILLAAALFLMMPVVAYAAEPGFAIENEHIFEGMDKAYKDGYAPAIKDGIATIVLPLVTDTAIKDDKITAAPGLGEPASSPFVYSNYQKTVIKANNAVIGGETVSSYLVRFDLPLKSGRMNGAYPVAVEITAEAADGTAIQQTFTTYVTVKDGKDPEAAEPTPKPEKPSSQPKILVSGYSVNPSAVEAGSEFTATVTLLNTSKKKSVQNMTVAVSCECPNLELLNESNTIYIEKLSKGKTTDIELRYKTDLETPPQRYNITLSMEYDNSDAQTLSSSGTVTVAVKQPLRVEIEAPKVPAEVNAGDTVPLSFQVMNMGRSKVYNVRCSLEAAGLIPSETAFLGNMEAGTAAQGEMDVFVGTKDMTEGYEGEDKYGFTSGKMTLVYEDENGKEYTEELEIHTMINPPVIAPVSAEPEEEPEKASQWWISLLVGGALIAVLATVLIMRNKKGRNDEDI